MTPSKRHDLILEKLRLEGQVRVRELADEFEVTDDCIRKDLALLSSQKKLKRIHGGALPIKDNPHALSVGERLSLLEEEKKAIATKALALIEPGMTIFLDISTTNIELAKMILEKKLDITVVTNFVDVLKVLSVSSPVQLIFLGGTLSHSMDGFTGSMTIEQIRRFHFDLAFLGAVGIDLADGQITTYDPFDGQTKQAILASSNGAYLLAETKKLNQQGNYIYACPDDFTAWICEGGLSDKEKKQAADCDLSIL